jgi:hypothetical protein
MMALKMFGIDGMRFRYFFLLPSLALFALLAVALLSRDVRARAAPALRGI